MQRNATCSTTTGAAIAGALTALAVFAASPALAQMDRSVTIVLSEEPDTLDGCAATRSNNGRVTQDNVTEGLTQIDPNTGNIEPRLATAWEQVDDLTWRFTLRDGVTFHDGAPLNAETAAYAINRTMDKDLDCNTRTEYFGQVDVTASAVGADTLELKTNIREPILPAYMTWVMLVSPNTPADELTLTAIGTGPYKYGDYKPGQEINLVRNDDWWGPKPQADSVTYIWRSESAVRAAMVEIGEADLAPDIGPQDANNPNTDVTYTNAETGYLRPDANYPPLDDRRVRLALNLSMDREGMRGTIFPKEAVPAANLVIPGIIGHNAGLEAYPFDPDRARALLAEAKADGVPVDAEITLIGRTNLYPNSTEMMEALLQMWTAVGFNMKLTMMEVGEWRRYHNKPFPEDRPANIIQTRHNNQSGDLVFTAFPKFACEGVHSTACDPAIDAKITEASQLSGDARKQAWEEMARIAHEDNVALVIQHHLIGHARVNPRINYTPTFLTNNVIEVSKITFN